MAMHNTTNKTNRKGHGLARTVLAALLLAATLAFAPAGAADAAASPIRVTGPVT